MLPEWGIRVFANFALLFPCSVECFGGYGLGIAVGRDEFHFAIISDFIICYYEKNYTYLLFIKLLLTLFKI